MGHTVHGDTLYHPLPYIFQMYLEVTYKIQRINLIEFSFIFKIKSIIRLNNSKNGN